MAWRWRGSSKPLQSCHRGNSIVSVVHPKNISLAHRLRRSDPAGRPASITSSTAGSTTITLGMGLEIVLLSTAVGLTLVSGYYYITDSRAGIHRWLVVPSMRWLFPDAEHAHEAGTRALRSLYALGLYPRERGNPDGAGDLTVEVFGHRLDNPIGISAGVDKRAVIPNPLLALGASIVEVGGVTPHPQAGNPKVRVFRVPSQKALINRYGLNSEGADMIAKRLRQRVREYARAKGFGVDEAAEKRILDGEAGVPPGSLTEGKLMAIQIAKNSSTPDQDIKAVTADYVYCVEALARYADIIVCNVSSPNTRGLRDLQKNEPLTRILSGVVEAVGKLDRKIKPAVMVKVSPDEDSEAEVVGICDAVWNSGVDGVIVGNTTKRRPDLQSLGHSVSKEEAAVLLEEGGYSGPQLFEQTLALVKRYRRLLDERAYGKQRIELMSEDGLNVSNLLTDHNNHMSESKSAPSIDHQTKDTAHLGLQGRKDSSSETNKFSKSNQLVRLPEPDGSSALPSSGVSTADLASTHRGQISQKPQADSTSKTSPLEGRQKVVFASGGITDGQALEVLNAGADVAMVYTALVYKGIGTITRIKAEMRDKIKEAKGS